MSGESSLARCVQPVVAVLLLVAGCYLLFAESPPTLTPVSGVAPAPSVPAERRDRSPAGDVVRSDLVRSDGGGGERSAANDPVSPGAAEGVTRVVVRVTLRGSPVAGAEVVWADAASVERHRVVVAAGAQRTPEPESLAARLRAVGEVASTGADGSVQLAVRGAPLALHAVHEGLTATKHLAEVTSGQVIELQIDGGDTLRLRCLDRDGQPVAGLPIAAVWQRADPATGLGQQRKGLGETDAEGRLHVLSWGVMARAANAALGSPGASTLVGPAVVGIAESGFLRVTERAPDEELQIRAPNVDSLVCQMVTAAGDAFFIDGLQTELWSVASVVASTAAESDGRSRHLVVRDVGLQWRVRFLGEDYGSGAIPSRASRVGIELLRCAAVSSVRGAVSDPVDRCVVSYATARRGEVVRSLEVRDGRFWFPLAGPERAPMLTFAVGDRRVQIEVPPVLPPVWELGELRGAVVPFARLRLSVRGEPFVGRVGWRTSGEGLPVGAAAVEAREGEYVVLAPGGIDELRVDGAVDGFAPFSLALAPGAAAEVQLLPLVDARIDVLTAPGLTAELLHVRLKQRWNEVEQAWQPHGTWQQVGRNGDGAFATFRGIAIGRYQVEVWSLAPPRALASAEVELDDAAPVALDVTGAREVRFVVDAGAEGCFVASGSTLDRDGSIGVRRLASGESVLTVAADEREVLLMGSGRAPQRGVVTGTELRAALRPFDAATLGLGERVSRLDPLVIGRSPRPVHVFHTGSDGVRFEVLGLPVWAKSVVLPCDYAVLLDGRQATASWDEPGWRLEPR